MPGGRPVAVTVGRYGPSIAESRGSFHGVKIYAGSTVLVLNVGGVHVAVLVALCATAAGIKGASSVNNVTMKLPIHF
jgi:hypothetical protein